MQSHKEISVMSHDTMERKYVPTAVYQTVTLHVYQKLSGEILWIEWNEKPAPMQLDLNAMFDINEGLVKIIFVKIESNLKSSQ